MSESPKNQTQPTLGSIKNKIVASDLAEERKNCNFDQEEMSKHLWNGQSDLDRVRGLWDDLVKDPQL